MREHETASEAPKRTVARSILDDVRGMWDSEPAARQAKPETPYTKQDWDQSLSQAAMPVQLALNDLRVGKPDRFKCGTAAARLPGAISALQTMAANKKDAANQRNILAPVADIQAAQTSLQVLGDWMVAPGIWKEAFAQARAAVDQALAKPSTDDPDAKAESDRIVSSVIPALERLIIKTSAPPFQAWDPLNYLEADDALAQLANVKGMEKARAAVERGKQAIATYAGDIQKSLDEAVAHLEAAQVKLSTSASSYLESATPEPPR